MFIHCENFAAVVKLSKVDCGACYELEEFGRIIVDPQTKYVNTSSAGRAHREHLLGFRPCVDSNPPSSKLFTNASVLTICIN